MSAAPRSLSHDSSMLAPIGIIVLADIPEYAFYL